MTGHKGRGSRREFLETVGGIGAGALLAGTTTESARGFAANDTLEIGCIGTGGRCRHLMKSLAKIPNVRISALADIFDYSREEARKLADPRATVDTDFRALLDRKDLDAVLIAAPDHWHVPMAVAACQAGKDVYVEKPLTHDPSEGPIIVAAQNDHKRIVQVGTQQRSMPHFIKGRELIKSGKIGRVLKVHMTWNRNTGGTITKNIPGINPAQLDWKAFLGNAPDQPFDAYRFANWRWFWDFGGGLLTDLMVHFLDVAHWVLDLDHPTKALTLGNHFAARGTWETPDTIQCLLSYPGDLQVYYEGTFSNARNGAMIEFMGTEGTLYFDRGAYLLYSEPDRKLREELVLGSNPLRGADFYDKPDGELLHLSNWIDCVRSRATPNAPTEGGVGAAAGAQLGNRSYRSGQVAEWPKA